MCSQVNSSSNYWTITAPGCKLHRPLRILLLHWVLVDYVLSTTIDFKILLHFKISSLALCALCYCTFIELRGSWVNPAKVPKRNWVSYNMCFPNWFELWLLNKYWSGMQTASPSSQLLLHWFLVDYVLSTIIDYYYYYYSKFFSISIWYNFTLTVCSLPFHFDNRSLNLRKLGQHC